MVWAYFLSLVGAVSTTAGLVICTMWEYLSFGALPDSACDLLGLGGGVLLLGILIMYAIDPENYLKKHNK